MTYIQGLEFLIHLLIFLIGAGIGSFLNVVIYRLPLGISVNKPRRSFCPSCKKQIPWYHNIPLVSWLLLRGKCAECGSRIAPRYFFVELFTACIFYAIFYKFHGPLNHFQQWGPLVLCYWIFASLLIAGTYIDLDHFILPHAITIGGFFTGLLGSFLVPQLMKEETHMRGLLLSFLSACVGLGLLWTVVELGKLAFGRIKRVFKTTEPWSISQPNEEEPPVFKVADLELTWDDIFVRASDKLIIHNTELTVNDRIFSHAKIEIRADKLHVILEGGAVETFDMENVKQLSGSATQIVIPREAMGFGDVLLLAMIGSFLGWKAVLFSIVAASFLGSACAIIPRLFGKTQWTAKIPFGPYLAAGGMIWLFYGAPILEWYLSRIGLD